MDPRFADQLTEGTRVVVPFGEIASEMAGSPPIVTTATVHGPAHEPGVLWCVVDVAKETTLPQMYKVEQIVGVLMPMAVVEHHADGSITGTLPLKQD